MTTLRRILVGSVLAVMSGSVASAVNIQDSESTLVTFATDNTYTLTMNKFNNDGGLYTLTGATLYFFGEEDVSLLSLTNTAGTAQLFDALVTSNLVLGSNNTASSGDKYTNEALDIFDTGIGPGLAQYPIPEAPITLGTSGTCPEYTPSSSCGTVNYTGPDIIDENINPIYGLTSGTGLLGVDGVIKNITGGDLANYIGLTTFALTGATKGLTTVSGGGNNLSVNINTQADFQGEIDYTYTVNSGTPEPASMLLIGSAMLGLGFVRRRSKKS